MEVSHWDLMGHESAQKIARMTREFREQIAANEQRDEEQATAMDAEVTCCCLLLVWLLLLL